MKAVWPLTVCCSAVKGRTHFLNFASDNLVDQSVEACVEECEAVIFPTVDMALRNAGIRPSEVRSRRLSTHQQFSNTNQDNF